ncbi:MAG: ABC transporter ATP-binding protein [Lachnospiraceae bacterium]|nr:ABC transporter ATP-binding protein [Lachnospiraceae bacterium]
MSYDKIKVWLDLIQLILVTIGLWNMFPKFGISKFWSIVPFGRFHKLAQCADREEDGIGCMICVGLEFILGIVLRLCQQNAPELTRMINIVALAILVVSVITLVHYLRIYIGLCEVFNRSKWWVLLWIAIKGVSALIWGCSKDFQPVNSARLAAAPLSGTTEAATNEGLVVNITKRTAGVLFNRTTLLRDIHFTIEPGRMILLLGGSGSGKTTLVNAITGYEKAKAKITLNGEDVYKNFDKMKYQIGFVPQQETIRLNDTVYSTVEDNAYLRLPSSVDDHELKERVNQVLEEFGLTAAKHRFVSKQSGGMKKRVSISMEYVSNPDLFVLDEPDSGLDGIMARSLMQKLHNISREGGIIIVITHTPDRVIDLFDGVLVLARDSARTGRLAFYGTVDEAKAFFEKDTMEGIVQVINRNDEGGEGRADEMIQRFEEVRS